MLFLFLLYILTSGILPSFLPYLPFFLTFLPSSFFLIYTTEPNPQVKLSSLNLISRFNQASSEAEKAYFQLYGEYHVLSLLNIMYYLPTLSKTFCTHEKLLNTCKICCPFAFCPHGRQKSKCKDCGGASICPHGRRKSRCKDCKNAK